MEKCYLIMFWNGEKYEDSTLYNLYVVFDEGTAKEQVQKLNTEYQIKCKRYEELYTPWIKKELTDEQTKEFEELDKERICNERYNKYAEYSYEELDVFAP